MNNSEEHDRLSGSTKCGKMRRHKSVLLQLSFLDRLRLMVIFAAHLLEPLR